MPEPYYSKGIQERFSVTPIPALQKSQEFAAIAFHPSLDGYLARSAKRIIDGRLENEVPAGWPTKLGGPMAWTGGDFPDESRFIYYLSSDDREEVRRALTHFKDQGLDRDEVSKANFPLPNLASRFTKACEEVYNGLGAVILRGIDVKNYTPEDLLVVFLGVSSYIAEQRGVQDRLGTMLKHLTDDGKADSQRDLPLHTDITCDVVATLTRQCSTDGGFCTIASSWAIYNELAMTRPDLIHILSKPDWPFDTYGRDPPFYDRALLYHIDDHVMLNFSRRVLTGHPYAPRSLGIPGLNEAQAEALDAVHFIGLKHQKRLSTKKGDIRFVNNMALLHGREAFFDQDKDAKSQRHLIRLWLHNSKMVWKLPTQLQLAWARAFEDGGRGRRWDLEPRTVNGIKVRTSSPCD
ncbi:MAG: hypothetical protein Q9221_007099 [Calogaya cf. arnoldii]